MALRLSLLSLVAILGLEPPSEPTLSEWSDAGRAGLTALRDRIEPSWMLLPTQTESPAADPARETTPVSEVARSLDVELADELFAAIVDDVARQFVADLAIAGAEKAVEVAGAKNDATSADAALDDDLAFEPALVDEDGFSGEAYRLNAPSAAGFVAEVLASIRVGLPEDRGKVRSERLASALRITGDALYAWASFLQGREVAVVRR